VAGDPTEIEGGTAVSSNVPVAEAIRESYTQKLWMRVKRKAAYLPGC